MIGQHSASAGMSGEEMTPSRARCQFLLPRTCGAVVGGRDDRAVSTHCARRRRGEPSSYPTRVAIPAAEYARLASERGVELSGKAGVSGKHCGCWGSAHRVDFAVVGDVAVRVRAGPGGKGVGGEPSAHERVRRRRNNTRREPMRVRAGRCTRNTDTSSSNCGRRRGRRRVFLGGTAGGGTASARWRSAIRSRRPRGPGSTP